jgi:uncharacterized membrane protein HdeD (DUF308 family)
MSFPSGTWEIATESADHRRWWWLRLLVGVATAGAGVAAIAWPETTVRVVGLLFGLNLLVTGAVRVGLCLVVAGYPAAYRVLGVIFGVLTVVVGLVCVRNVIGSAILLVLIVAIGWLLDGVLELIGGLGGRGDPGRAWRIAAGALSVVAAVAVLVWPELTLATFVAVGAIVLIVAGIVQIAGAVGSLRSPGHRVRPAGNP